MSLLCRTVVVYMCTIDRNFAAIVLILQDLQVENFLNFFPNCYTSCMSITHGMLFVDVCLKTPSLLSIWTQAYLYLLKRFIL
jgi:hypothetical protein